MFPLLIPMAIGAGAGALTSKKPLQGALMGAGLGALGGAAAPAVGGLLGGGATGAAPAATGAATSGAGFGLGQPLVTGALGESTMAGQAAGGGGVMSGAKGLLDTANTYAPLLGTMMGGMGSGNEQQAPQAPAPTMSQGGSDVLASIAGRNTDPMLAADAQARAQRRNQRRMV